MRLHHWARMKQVRKKAQAARANKFVSNKTVHSKPVPYWPRDATSSPSTNELHSLTQPCTFDPEPLPTVEARPQCVIHDDCRINEQCHTGSCIDACRIEGCGVNAVCTARLHAATCACPPGYTGDPRRACYPSKYKHVPSGERQSREY